MNEYQALKWAVRLAKIELANVPGVSLPGTSSALLPGGALDRGHKRIRNCAMGKVRRAAKRLDAYRKRHCIVVPEFFVPRKPCWRDAKIRRQYDPHYTPILFQ
jgi:hypothetical protein